MEKNNNELLLEKMIGLSIKLRRQMFGMAEGHGGQEGRGPHGRGFGGPEAHGPHGRGFGGPEAHGPHGRGFGGPEAHGPHGRGFGGPEAHDPHGEDPDGPKECLEALEESIQMPGGEDTPFPFDGISRCKNRMNNMDRGPSACHRPHRARERMLRIIGEEEGISQKKLAEYFRIRPQSLSELLGKLERDGYVDRRQNEQDKREILVFLTEQGKLRAEEVEAARAQQTAALFSPLTEEEKETLIALLEKLMP